MDNPHSQKVTGMTFVKLATLADFADQRIKSFSVLGKKIGIVKRDNGEFYAIEVGCKHQGADITKGKIDGTIVTCPRHGWQYDLESGECLNHDSPRLRRHALIVEGNDIKVSATPRE